MYYQRIFKRVFQKNDRRELKGFNYHFERFQDPN